MPAEVSLTGHKTGAVTFYRTYKEARENSQSGDLNIVYSDTKQRIKLKDRVDIVFAEGVVMRRK